MLTDDEILTILPLLDQGTLAAFVQVSKGIHAAATDVLYTRPRSNGLCRAFRLLETLAAKPNLPVVELALLHCDHDADGCESRGNLLGDAYDLGSAFSKALPSLSRLAKLRIDLDLSNNECEFGSLWRGVKAHCPSIRELQLNHHSLWTQSAAEVRGTCFDTRRRDIDIVLRPGACRT